MARPVSFLDIVEISDDLSLRDLTDGSVPPSYLHRRTLGPSKEWEDACVQVRPTAIHTLLARTSLSDPESSDSLFGSPLPFSLWLWKHLLQGKAFPVETGPGLAAHSQGGFPEPLVMSLSCEPCKTGLIAEPTCTAPTHLHWSPTQSPPVPPSHAEPTCTAPPQSPPVPLPHTASLYRPPSHADPTCTIPPTQSPPTPLSHSEPAYTTPRRRPHLHCSASVACKALQWSLGRALGPWPLCGEYSALCW